MGFWKDVAYDMQRGMSKQDAIRLNADLKYGNLSKEEKARLEAKAEANLKIDSMK
jgi:hypothetical protein